MNYIHCAIAAATLSLVLLSPAAQGEAGREPVSARITVRDLNLADAAGRNAFADRVHRAARRACGTGIGVHARQDIQRCRGEMERNAAARLATLTRDRPVELASATPR